MKKNNQSNFIITVLICLTILCLLNSSLITKQILIYTKLFIEKLFPSSFLFFTLSTLLIEFHVVEKLNKLLKKDSASLYILMMSLISGFPSGSKYIKELLEKNLITKTTANYLIKFTHFPNPIFILGPVSLLFSSKKYSIIILISIISSNILIALINNPKEKNQLKILTKEIKPFSKILPSAIFSSLKTIIMIYGISIFFYLISTIINYYLKLKPIGYILVNGLFDLTSGIFSTSLIQNQNLKAILIILFISFGSISIHMQTKSIISDTKIQYKNFLLGRIYQTILAITVFFLLILCF